MLRTVNSGVVYNLPTFTTFCRLFVYRLGRQSQRRAFHHTGVKRVKFESAATTACLVQQLPKRNSSLLPYCRNYIVKENTSFEIGPGTGLINIARLSLTAAQLQTGADLKKYFQRKLCYSEF